VLYTTTLFVPGEYSLIQMHTVKSLIGGVFRLILVLLIHSAISQEIDKGFNYSAIAESYGYADRQADQDVSETREQAYNDAKRNILEKTLIHIRSYSKVENFRLEYDLVQSESEGFLRLIEKKDLGFTGENRYCVWIKAEIIYVFDNPDRYPNDQQSAVGPLSVKFWTEKEKYVLNEKVKVFLMANKDCYLTLIYHDAENNVLQIFPNQHINENFIQANKLYTIPDDSDPYEFTVSSPFGEEKLTVYASTSQLGPLPMENHGPDFYKFKGDEEEYAFKTRGVKITNKEVPSEFFQESCKIVIAEK